MIRFFTWWKSVFTAQRWGLNPFQMYDISMLAAVALTQIILGASPGSVQEDLQRHTLLALAFCNVVGCSIAMVGLHLKELELALWIELWGYLCLIFVLTIYLTLLFQGQVNANATYGYGLGEAFVYASVHRGIQIVLYKRARSKSRRLQTEAVAMRSTLETITPSAPVVGEGELQ